MNVIPRKVVSLILCKMNVRQDLVGRKPHKSLNDIPLVIVQDYAKPNIVPKCLVISTVTNTGARTNEIRYEFWNANGSLVSVNQFRISMLSRVGYSSVNIWLRAVPGILGTLHSAWRVWALSDLCRTVDCSDVLSTALATYPPRHGHKTSSK